MTTKVCKKCGVEKDETEFAFRDKKAGRRRADCKICLREKHRKYREANREKVRERNRKYYKANRDKMLEYYKANRDKMLEKSRKWAKENPDKVRESSRKWYEANREKIQERVREWAKENPDKVRERARRRRAKLANCEGPNFTEADVRDLLKKQNGKCVICTTPITMDTLHRDHRIPLALGGDNSRDNLQLLCSSCNLSKNAKDPIYFAQERGFLIL